MDSISLRGVKTHNLKNFDLDLPYQKLYVITGVSGSGKSSLAFDTLYAEGNRRYVESLSAYARQFLERMEKPDVEFIQGIRPAIAIESKNTINNARSTVGTQTEVNDYLRVLFARIGKTICPKCEVEVVENQPSSVANFLLSSHADEEAILTFDIKFGKKGKSYLKEFLPELERQGFSEFLLEGKIIETEELLEAKKLPDFVKVIVDRTKAREKNKKRIIDSIELGFRYGHGEIGIKVGKKSYTFSEALKCPSCSMIFKTPSPNLFSFNSPLGACSACQGFGRVITIDWDLVIPDSSKTLAGGAIEPWTKPSASWEAKRLVKFCKKNKIPMNKPWKKLSKVHRDWLVKGHPKQDFFSVSDFFKYLEKKTYKMHVRIFLSKYRTFVLCGDCSGTRLKPEASYVRVEKKMITEFQDMLLSELQEDLKNLKLTEHERERVEPVYLEILQRVRFLNEVGLGYLSLSRLSRTLSGGEVQRINLATSLGSALVDTLYVLDEPSIGLHERDNDLLIRLLYELRDLGNTVVVVEHDRTMIEYADEVIDMGPLGGEMGGHVIYQGDVEGILDHEESLTGQYLSGRKEVKRRRSNGQSYSGKKRIHITGAQEHNLKSTDVSIPLHQMVVITGVSGSGKSTLLYDVLYNHYLRFRGRPVQNLGKVKSIKGFESIDEVVLIDQSPIGRTPRSNPVTYIKAFDEIRKAFARTHQARLAGLEAGHFSFNVDKGRCVGCKGDGRVKVEMHFLADVFVPCAECRGKRFKPEVLEVLYQGKNIDDVLGMTIDAGIDFFKTEKNLVEKLMSLQRAGLGYLRLGQSATTLSGGEAQRLKLAAEMTSSNARHILYIFDEPTTGLHYHDIHYLMQAFDQLVSDGHSLLIIEHNMEIIRSADHVIDLGPDGGSEGGELVYAGDLKGLMACKRSYTGQYLKKYIGKGVNGGRLRAVKVS